MAAKITRLPEDPQARPAPGNKSIRALCAPSLLPAALPLLFFFPLAFLSGWICWLSYMLITYVVEGKRARLSIRITDINPH